MPRATKSADEVTLLMAALEGLELQRQRIEEQIRNVRTRLGRRGPRPAAGAIEANQPAAAKKRELSPAARKRIALAQKKRWAEYRKRSASEQKED